MASKSPPPKLVENRIVDYVEAATGKLLYSIPYCDPEGLYTDCGRPYHAGMPYQAPPK